MIVPITDRARKFGYLIWPKASDEEMRALLGDTQTVMLTFQGADLGSKTVDWKHRRISIGPRRTRELPAAARSYVLDFSAPKLTVTAGV